MGGAIGGLPETPALSDDSGPKPGAKTGEGGSIGAYLKRQRKLRGLSLADLESATRVPKRSLERLEAGAYDGIPDGFVRQTNRFSLCLEILSLQLFLSNFTCVQRFVK